jgi:hypothetical protein
MIERIDTGIAQGLGTNYRCSSEGTVTDYRVSENPGLLVQLLVSNTGNQSRFIQLFDAIEKPEEDTVPLVSLPLPENSAIGLDTPIAVQNGLIVAISTNVERLVSSFSGAMIFANFNRR